MNTSANRRPAAAEPTDRATPPPLQQPDQHGHRRDPAADAWLPESTLDPATRAWLTGEDRRRSGEVAPVPVQTPDSFAPRSAPTHVHGAGSGLDGWAGAPGARRPEQDPASQRSVPAEPSLDPDAQPAQTVAPEDDPEVTRLAPRSSGAPAPTPAPPVAPVDPVAPVAPVDQAAPAAPFWAAAPEAPTPAPSAPSWWIGRAGDDTAGSPERETASGVPAPTDGSTEPTTDAPTDDRSPVADGSAVDTAPGEVTAAATSVGQTDARVASEPPEPEAPRAGDTAVVEPLVDRRPPRPAPLVQPGTHPTTCHVCGHQLEPDDIFCNECGAVRPAVTAAFTGPVVPLPVARPDWAAQTTSADEPDDVVEPDNDDLVEPNDVEPEDVVEPDDVVESDGLVESDDESGAPDPSGSETPSEELGDADAGHRAPTAWELDDVAPEQPAAPTAAPLPPIPDMPGPALPLPTVASVPSSGDADETAQLDEGAGAGADVDASGDDDEDVDQTRIVSRTPTRAPFLLHCSTGERLGVHGTGLLGRLPRPQPGERFDDLLTIHDPGKSVSKTHLEIGRDGDDLWVSDRFSGNGSVIRHIDGSIRRCEPGRRYRVERGARVDIGEQFFLVQ
ncbi:hypothetical protein [Curtobacterium sp. MCBA15_001]|uniref:hypothetical protein n=1 Tax=Curtobacterium sp. MCBA15_001 TaxID=1898731 RepID=UPI0008DC7A43|nr:hypothetical protein [Curtobacterium sp. MCBA15_001]OIH93497.1 hypothetical protein BIU90_07355 [Curtobacterium sp. MCBA15_001]